MNKDNFFTQKSEISPQVLNSIFFLKNGSLFLGIAYIQPKLITIRLQLLYQDTLKLTFSYTNLQKIVLILHILTLIAKLIFLIAKLIWLKYVWDRILGHLI